jgi:hypothetical protein
VAAATHEGSAEFGRWCRVRPLSISATHKFSGRRALHDAASFELGGNPEHGEHQLGEVGRGIDNRLMRVNAGQLRLAACHERSPEGRSYRARAGQLPGSAPRLARFVQRRFRRAAYDLTGTYFEINAVEAREGDKAQ